ncbi:MAG TPA: DUF2171 domain-containing protein [Sphingomicrobium sp.]
MAYDRYDTRNTPRDERSRWSDDRFEDRDWGRENHGQHSRGENRGFFERAGDEIASWFGDDDAERRRRQNRTNEGQGTWTSSRDRDHNRGSSGDWERDRRWTHERGQDRGFSDRGWERSGGRGYSASERDHNPRWRDESRGSGDFERSLQHEQDRDYRPVTGDYGRGGHESEQFFAASGVGRGQRAIGDEDRFARSHEREEHRRGNFSGSSQSRDFDPHYHSWRQRHMSELDRDYDDYRRENSSRFENDFTSWRERRMQKRGLLRDIREHMDVVGKDDKHVGTIDRVAGARIILTKSDPESGGVHHSLSCSDIDRIEGDRVILDTTAEEARQRWRDESRGRALFEREDRGEMGPRVLDRSFEGTYR